MFKINHAILHVFDFVSCVNVFSQEELDLSDKNVKSYVQRVAKHALGNIDNKRGEFEAESGFKNELSDYLNGQSNFTDLCISAFRRTKRACLSWPGKPCADFTAWPSRRRKRWRFCYMCL